MRRLVQHGLTALVLLIVLLHSTTASAIDVVRNVRATMGNAGGWNDRRPTNRGDSKFVHEGEPIRVYWSISKDKRKVKECRVEISMTDVTTKKVLKTYKPTTLYKSGRHRFTIPGDWRLSGDFKRGIYSVEVRTTVVTPRAEKGSTDVDWSWVLLRPMKKWNMIVFISGDNSLSGSVKGDLEEMDIEDSNENVNCIVLYDRKLPKRNGRGDTRCIRIQQNFSAKRQGIHLRYNRLRDNSYELNTGDPEEAYQFFKWVHENHPAEKWMVIFWDHGDGFRKHNSDDTSKNAGVKPSHLTLNSTAKVLGKLKTLRGRDTEIVGFDNCLMAMLEVGYALKDSAQYLVASQRREGSAGWYHQRLIYYAGRDESPSPEQMAKLIVKNGRNSSAIRTISAMRLRGGPKNVVDLATSVDKFAGALNAESTLCPEQLIQARKDCGVSDGGTSTSKDINTYVDLYDYANQVDMYCQKAPKIRSTAQAVKATIQKVLVAEYSPTYRDHNGISIYYPDQYIHQGPKRDPNKHYPMPVLATKPKDPANVIPRGGGTHIDDDVALYKERCSSFVDGPGAKWHTWIQQDIVPPTLQYVKIWQKKGAADQIIYEGQRYRNRQRAPKVAHAGELHIRVRYDEEMDATKDPKITFGRKDPYEAFVFQKARGWYKDKYENNTWEGKILLQPTPDRLNGEHKLIIDGTDKRGNKMDIKWLKVSRQVDEKGYLTIKVRGLPYLAKVAAKQDKKAIYEASWRKEENHRAFIVKRQAYINLNNGPPLKLSLEFNNLMKPDSIRVDVGSDAKGLTAKKVKPTQYEVTVPIAKLQGNQGGKAIPVTVHGEDVAGYKLDANPTTFPTVTAPGSDGKVAWTLYESGRLVAGENVGGPDTWHALNFIGSSTVYLIDVSDSMKENNRLEKAKKAAKKGLALLPNNSEAALIVFSGCKKDGEPTRIEQGFTTNTDELIKKIDALRPSGNTPLYDSIAFARKYMQQNSRNRIQKLVILSDGGDNCGSSRKPSDEARKLRGGIPPVEEGEPRKRPTASDDEGEWEDEE